MIENPKKIDLNTVIEVGSKILETSGNLKNSIPCRYTNFAGQHCFVGQILIDLGVKIPNYGEDGNGLPFSLHEEWFPLFTEGAFMFLRDVQVKADYTDMGGNEPRYSWQGSWDSAMEGYDDYAQADS